MSLNPIQITPWLQGSPALTQRDFELLTYPPLRDVAMITLATT